MRPPFALGSAPPTGPAPEPAARRGTRAKEPPFRLTIRDVVTPQSFAELLDQPDLAELLFRGLVYLHDKSPLSDRLIGLLRARAPRPVTLEDVPDLASHSARLTDALAVERGRRKRSRVFIVPAQSAHAPTEKLVQLCSSGRPRLNGLWVLGFPAECASHVLRLFDVILMFDMAATDLDKLRSVIPLPRNVADDLSKGDAIGQERVLIFFNTERARRGWRIRVTGNPAVLPFLPQNTRTPTLSQHSG